jgi:hypothetical protein
VVVKSPRNKPGKLPFLHRTLGAALRSIGLMGTVLATALCAAFIWLFMSWSWLSLQNTQALTWIGLMVLALILTFGVAWSHLYRCWTSQATVDEVDQH